MRRSTANYAFPNAAIAPSLGRNLSGNAQTATINLVTPGDLYGDRINQIDLRVGKVLKFGGLADAIQRRSLQRAELERHPDLQPDVHRERRVADAER